MQPAALLAYNLNALESWLWRDLSSVLTLPYIIVFSLRMSPCTFFESWRPEEQMYGEEKASFLSKTFSLLYGIG